MKTKIENSIDACLNHLAPELAKRSPEAVNAFQNEEKIFEWRMKASNFDSLSKQLALYERALNVARAHLDQKVRKEINEILEGN